MQKRLFFLVAVLLTLSLTAMAQITTSSMALWLYTSPQVLVTRL